MPMKDGKWEDLPCYLAAMGQIKCGGNMILKDVTLIQERVVDRVVEEGRPVVNTVPARLVKTYVCDTCGFVWEDDKIPEARWRPA